VRTLVTQYCFAGSVTLKENMCIYLFSVTKLVDTLKFKDNYTIQMSLNA
jgi:polynucleotide 5'-kinase involved in rRNA processing